MIKIGITGGIGCGKTRICRLMEQMEIPIYYTDDKAKELMVSNGGIKAQVKEEFGPESYNADGTLNRSYLASIVFSDAAKLEILEKIVHPIMQLDFEDWCEKNSKSKFVACESAILYKTGLGRYLNAVLYVTAPEEQRIERVIKRDNATREQVIQRIKAQQNEIVADYVIENTDGTTDTELMANLMEILSIINNK